MGTLSGKVALITGGGKGMGRAVAKLFAAEGAKVAIAARTQSDIDEVAAEAGHGAIPIRLDVTDRSAWDAAVETVRSTWGKLNILVHGAGLTEAASIEESSTDNWRRHMAINLDGPFFGCQAALPLMKESGEPGSIVNISSAFSVRPMPGFGAYCSSKAGLNMFTKVLALECAAAGYPIRVNSILPGGTETDMFEKALADTGLPREEAYQMFLGIHPMGRIGKPEEIAQACLWLASDASSYTTGTAINVDGGSFIRP